MVTGMGMVTTITVMAMIPTQLRLMIHTVMGTILTIRAMIRTVRDTVTASTEESSNRDDLRQIKRKTI